MLYKEKRVVQALVELGEVKIRADAEGIAKQLGVEDVLRYLLENNPSGDLPYHNNLHAMSVAVAAFNLFHQTNRRLRQRHPNSQQDNVRHLFVAGLFHDYNHSGGHLVDSENIQRAVEGWREAFGWDVRRFGGTGRVEAIIRATEFPWKEIPFRHTHAIIRDADFLASAETGTVFIPIDGLRIELGWMLGKRLSAAEMYARQPDFFKGLVLNTVEGRERWKLLMPCILEAQKVYVTT